MGVGLCVTLGDQKTAWRDSISREVCERTALLGSHAQIDVDCSFWNRPARGCDVVFPRSHFVRGVDQWPEKMVAGGDTSFMSDTSTGSPLSDTVTSTRPLTGRQASDRPRGYSNASMERGTIRCAGRLWIFFVLGTLVIVVGMVIGGLYLNIRNVTTSSQHTEVVPTYVVALLVSGKI